MTPDLAQLEAEQLRPTPRWYPARSHLHPDLCALMALIASAVRAG